MPTEHPSPLFIVGSPRSGTSILVAALLHPTAYRDFNEGNFLGLLEHLHRATDRYFGAFWSDNPRLMLSHVDRGAFKASLSELFKRIVDRANPEPPWLDKSGNPAVIRLIPVLTELWPSSHFIFVRRRGIENIVSRVKKFPMHSFEYHCQDWADNMAAWRAARRELPELRRLELDQQDMVRNFRAAAAKLATFLGFSPAQQARLASVFRAERPEQSEDGSAARVLSLQTTGWSPRERDLFARHCQPEMDFYGYTLDTDYRTGAPQGAPAHDVADSTPHRSGRIVAEESLLGDASLAILYLDRCAVANGAIELEGWALAADLGFVESIDLFVGGDLKPHAPTARSRPDVLAARPGAAGAECGFLIEVPIERVAPEETFVFVVTTKAGQQRFWARVRFQ